MIVSESALIINSGIQYFVYTAINRNHFCSINILCLLALYIRRVNVLKFQIDVCVRLVVPSPSSCMCTRK